MDTLTPEPLQQEFQVIARKWRPVSFEDVIGQEHIITTLQNAISHNRIAHAYLFTGSRGVGKTSTARIFARALNCVNGPTITPCGTCRMCEEIIQGNSMDVMEIDGASNRGIDQIRELRESVKFVPSQGTFKIYIIDEVHMLTKEAFNALLKTLEEPPSHVIFIFATTEPHRMLPTILSRCQRFDFRRISQSKISAQLKKIAKADNIEVEHKVIEAIAKAGDGSMRDAQSMFDQIISFSGSKISFNQVSQILGLYDIDYFTNLVYFSYKKDINSGIASINKIIREGQDVNHVLEGLLNHYRHLLLVRLLDDKNDVLECTQEELKTYKDQSKLYTPIELEYAIELISDVSSKMRFALSKQTSMELLFLKLARLKSIISIDQALTTLSEIETKLRSAPVVGVHKIVNDLNETNAEANETIISGNKISSDDTNIVNETNTECEPLSFGSTDTPLLNDLNSAAQEKNITYENKIDNQPIKKSSAPLKIDKETIEKSWRKICLLCSNSLLKSFIEMSKILNFEDNVLTLGMKNNFGVDFFKDKEKVEEVEKILKQSFNADIKIKIQLDIKKNSNINTQPENKIANKNSLSKQEDILNDPKVQMLLDSFSAKVVKLRKE